MDFLKTKTDILIFYANAFDSKGEDGTAINGCTVHYLFWGENGTALVGQSEPDVTKPVGLQRGKSWVDYMLRNKIRIAPAIYEGTFVMDVDSKGKPTLKLVDVAYKSNVKMEAYKINGLIIPGMVEDTGDAPEMTTDPVTSVPDETAGSDMPSPDETASDETASPDAADKNDTAASNAPSSNASAKDHKSRK
ncbi:MAG: hypothetical protein NC123_20250 [Butyrivibrio sp.]|nr:hypothetical protein [Butyrivibrio sp.]